MADSADGVEVSLVAAVDRKLAIGRDNGLPWHLPGDLAHFKARTVGRTILMGRRTAESLGRALPKRRNLVLTRSGRAPFPGMEAVASVDEALALGGAAGLCVIGGGEIYALTLPRATVLHMTHVDTVVEGAHAFFPPLDDGTWRAVSRVAHPADARHAFAFEFVEYRRA
ncbi:MAG TPA: dihydrofolate reductase [Luteimonas sp.]